MSGVKLAENFAARGVLGAANMLWVDHFVNERYDEAQRVFDRFLRSQDIVLFRSAERLERWTGPDVSGYAFAGLCSF